MSVSGIQGLPLEVTVVGCYNLEDKEWISRQDPYVCVEYGNSKFSTKTCTDGGKNPVFQERFTFTLIEGLRELNVVVWNNRTIKSDEFIGCGKIQLHKVLSQGFDDSVWPLQSKSGRHSGEIRLISHFSSSNAFSHSKPNKAPQYAAAAPFSQVSPYAHAPYYPPQPPPTYPPAAGYPPPQAYPPTGYPPQSQTYPPASPVPPYSPYPPTGPASGSYPPPPYY